MSVKKRAKELGYSGELLTPITMPWPPPDTDLERMTLKQEVYGTVDKRIELLMKHYKLEATSSDRWRQLALLLAHDWVPGFKLTTEYPRTRGRKIRIPPEAQVDLFNRIEAIRVSQKLKLGEATQQFLRQNRSDALWGGKKARYLENQYREGGLQFRLIETLKDTSFAGYAQMFRRTGPVSRRRRRPRRTKAS